VITSALVAVDQRAHQVHSRRVGCAHQQRVATHLGDHCGTGRDVRAGAGRAGHRAAAGIDQALHQRRQVGGQGVAQRQHLDPRTRRHIERRQDASDSLQVVGVIGDHQRIGTGAHVDRVVGADQRAQHRHEVVGSLVMESKYLRHQLVACGGCPYAHRSTLELGVRLGYDLEQTIRVDHGKARQAKQRQKMLVGLLWRHGLFGHQVHRALDPRVDDDVAANDAGHGAGNGLDLCIAEVQRHGLACNGGYCHQRR